MLSSSFLLRLFLNSFGEAENPNRNLRFPCTCQNQGGFPRDGPEDSATCCSRFPPKHLSPGFILSPPQALRPSTQSLVCPQTWQSYKGLEGCEAEPTLRTQSPNEGNEGRTSTCFLVGLAFQSGGWATEYVKVTVINESCRRHPQGPCDPGSPLYQGPR